MFRINRRRPHLLRDLRAIIFILPQIWNLREDALLRAIILLVLLERLGEIVQAGAVALGLEVVIG